MPFLGKQYGDALESGDLKLAFVEGHFELHYFDRVLPIDPKSTIPVLAHRMEELQEALGEASDEVLEFRSIITGLEHLPGRTELEPEKVEERQREKEVLKLRMRRLCEQSASIREFVERNVAEFNGRIDDPQSFDRLDALLADQAYRLSNWRAASDEVNYRRFFDINELAALRMEEPEAFERTHDLVLDLLARDDVQGLRIDHIDGLFDPEEHLWRLQWAYLERLGRMAFERGRSEGRFEDEQVEWSNLSPSYMQAICRRLAVRAPAFDALYSEEGQMGLPATDGAEVSLAEFETGDGNRRSGWQWPLYVVVEKILGPEEPLPREWPVAGTTGYDFLNELNGLFVDARGLGELQKFYARFLGEKQKFEEIAYRSKLLILQVAMSSELQMLAYRLNRISEQHRRWRDFTLNMLRLALREILAAFPIYRTYLGQRGVSERDRRFVYSAVSRAKRRNPAIDAEIFDFIRDTLVLDLPPGTSDSMRRECEVFAGRFQQVTSPVTAKGLEDTAFYLYCPLISINEVGGEPRSGPTTTEQFHHENQQRLSWRAGSLLATTTHDTKRSEDVRARINALSEVPRMWRTAFNRWARLNRRHRQEVDGLPAPGRNAEYLFYQTLVGVWPLGSRDAEQHAELIRRLQTYMEKATREAKRRTSWISPNAAYDRAVHDFVAAVLRPSASNRFIEEFETFHRRVVHWGLYSALSQTLLKMMSPGVPDVYQGQELWDFSLVDPDNRRPVDFDRRAWLLAELKSQWQRGGAARREMARQLGQTPTDDRNKLLVTWLALDHRRHAAELMQAGRYASLVATGPRAEHVCAFAWRNVSAETGQDLTLVVAPRLLTGLTPPSPEEPTAETRPPVGERVWGSTTLDVRGLGGTVVNRFTGERVSLEAGSIALAEVLADYPVALLVREP